MRAGPCGPGPCHPPLARALDRARTTGQGWVRLAPEFPYETVPELAARAAEAEWISYEGEAQEAVLWFFGAGGAPRPPPAEPLRRATLLPGGNSLTGPGLPAPTPRPLGHYLYEPDPAVVPAGLLAELVSGGLAHAAGPLRTGDEPHPTPHRDRPPDHGRPALPRRR
ncbi:hypothetical protein [Streptomyces sp. NPDC047014]|uniref:hypothetical protein n=1 Tax=Streptomyces sp. NPDC047014 TaxID=3155736 RepID=UPI003401656A